MDKTTEAKPVVPFALTVMHFCVSPGLERLHYEEWANACYTGLQEPATNVQPRFPEFAHCGVLWSEWFSMTEPEQPTDPGMPDMIYVTDGLRMPEDITPGTGAQNTALAMITGQPVKLNGYVGVSLLVMGPAQHLYAVVGALAQHGHFGTHHQQVARQVRDLNANHAHLFVIAGADRSQITSCALTNAL